MRRGEDLVGRLVRPHVQPILLFASPLVFGAVAHLAGAALLREPLDGAFVAGTLWPTNLPQPVHSMAGSLMGVSVGLGWARSFLHEDEEEEVRPEPRPE